MISQILTPFDGTNKSRQAAEIAGGLARYLDVDLRVIAHAAAEDFEAMRPDLNDFVDIMRGRYGIDPIVVSFDKSDLLSHELLSESRDLPGTIICMAADNRGRRSMITISTAVDVLTYTDSPVVLVGPSCERVLFDHDGPLVVAIDDTERSESILDVAHEWASALDLAVELVTVVDVVPAPELAEAIASGDIVESAHVARVARDQALRDDDTSYEVRHGKPAEEIVAAAKQHNASMVALCSRVPLGFDRLLHGSVLDSVAHDSPVPVLALNHHPFLG